MNQEWKQGLWRRAAYWLIPHGLLSSLPSTMQDHEPRDGTAHSELGLLVLTINQDSTLQTCLQDDLIEALSQLSISSSQIYLGLCQVDKNQSAYIHNIE